MKKIALLAVIAALVFGCKSGSGVAQSHTQTPENSVRAAIQDHLAHNGNLNLQAFDTDVKQVTIQGDHAQADVEFRIKGGPGAMELTYSLEKHDGAWSVIDSDPAGSNFSRPASNGGQGESQGESSTIPGASHSLADTLRSFGAGVPPATR
jgi:hypothetical protein